MSIFRNLLMQQNIGWTNKPADWSDICEDCPANSIALYAAQSSIYTKVGNPTIVKGVVSGLSSSNYLKLTQSFSPGNNPWEIVISFTTPNESDMQTWQRIFASDLNNFGVILQTGLDNIDLFYYQVIFFTNGYSQIGYVGAKNNPQTIIQPNTKYFVKITFNGTKYEVYTSTNGSTYTKAGEIISSTPIYSNNQNYYLGYGVNSQNSPIPYKGSIDLNETYIKVNGSELVNSSAYDNLGFTANCTGGYNVFVDGVQYGRTYASGTTCPITWSKYNPNLPYGYTQLEYLQTDGASYIDTGVIGKGNATTLDFAYSSSNDDRAVFGARQASNVRMFELAQLVGGGGRFDYNNSTASLDFGASVKHICKTKIDGSYYTVERYNSDGVLQNSYNFTLNNFETPYTLDLFARNNNGTVNAFSTDAKIYYFKIYEDGVLVRNFIPCKNSSNVLGMYDTVNDVFYENEGTGDFIAGNEIIPGTNGDIITTPSLMKAHKIWIVPAISGNNITAFSCRRVASSGQEFQGLLWEHFNITNAIALNNHTNLYNNYRNSILVACTAKNNNLKVSNLTSAFWSCIELSYVPIIDLNSNTLDFSNSFARTKVKNIIFKKGTISNLSSTFEEAGIEKIKSNSLITNASSLSKSFKSATSVIDFDKLNIDWTNVTDATDFIYNSKQIKDTVLDTRAGTRLKKIGCYATSNTYFIQGFKGLRVSNQAPFNNATAPQINISYTGMDRQALVTLFNDLPTVSSGQIINITGCTGSADLTYQDVSIAVDKGWTVTGGPEFIKLSAYKNTQGELVYVNESDTSSWTQPYLTSDGVMGGDTCAVESDVTFIGTEDKTYYGFNGDNINCFHSANGATKGYFTFYSPDAINVTQITFTNQGTNYRRASGSGIIWGSNDNINFEYISSYTNNSSNNTWNIDLSSNTKYYKYYKLYSNGTKGDSYWTFEDCHFTATYIDGTLYDSDFVPEQTSYNKIFEGLQNSYVVGTLTNNNGVFSGFQNNANYINYFNSTKYPTVNNLEILFKVKTGSSFSGSDRIMNDATSADNFVVGCVESNAWLRINDSDNKGVGIPLTYATNTDYWFKFTYNADNDGTYKGYYSTDGVNWSEPSVQENPLAPAINMQQFNFGLRTTGVDNVCVWKGSIDLPNSYIIINDDNRIFYNKQTGIIINNTFFARSPADDDYISR